MGIADVSPGSCSIGRFAHGHLSFSASLKLTLSSHSLDLVEVLMLSLRKMEFHSFCGRTLQSEPTCVVPAMP